MFKAAFLACTIVLGGCSSSDDMVKNEPLQPGVIEMLQLEVNNLRAENTSLKQQVAKLEEEKRTATARVAELETEVTELKENITVLQTPPKPVIADVRESYQQALQLYRSHNYEDAAAMFQALLDAGIPERLEDNCHYWLGECAYGAKRYQEAIEHFQKVFGFRMSEKKDEAQIMIANCYYAMGDNVQAKLEYEKLITKFPASPYVKKAKERLSGL